jgi:1-acyl-sn-glycerol-3-phosphate acyltransferase
VHLLSRELVGRSSYIAQEEKHLARYHFLNWLGAFGIDLDGSPTAGLRYALRVLGDPKTLVWFFPQGHIVHPTKPIVAKSGASFIAKKSNAQILPVIIRYEWMIESRPSILIKVGAPLPETTKAKELQICLQGLFDEVIPEPGKFSETFLPLFKPRMSINKKLDFFMHCFRGDKTPFERENR